MTDRVTSEQFRERLEALTRRALRTDPDVCELAEAVGRIIGRRLGTIHADEPSGGS